jgi:hypothetical protein
LLCAAQNAFAGNRIASTLVALPEEMAMNDLIKSGAMALCLMVAASAGGQGIETIAAYAGTWTTDIDHVTTPYSKVGHEHTQLRNDCWRSGGYFACNQYVDGVSKALLVFTYDAASKSYTSYPIPPDGSAAGQGKLEIKGNVWTFPWQTKYGDKTTWFRVVNVWVKPDRIEFRQEFSTDNVKWTEMAHGVEVKTAG